MAKERIIWSNYDVRYEDWEDDWRDYLDVNCIEEEESNLYEWVDETLGYYLDDERSNLKKEVDGVIVAFANLGLWDGHHQGAKIVGTNIKNILYSECDYAEWYCDVYNVRFKGAHHDGGNTILYRVAKDRDTAERLVDKIVYDGMTEEQFRKATKSLRPYVAKIYGW